MRTWLRERLTGLSLAQAFIAFTGSLVFLTALTIALSVIRTVRRHEEQRLLAHGQNLAAILAQNAEYALYTEDPVSLAPLLSVVDIDEDAGWVCFVSLRDGTARTVASRAKAGHSAGAGGATEIVADVVAGAEARSVADEYAGGAPRKLGQVRLRLAREHLERNTRDFVAAVAAVTAVLITLGVGLTVLLARTIAGPIAGLRRAAREIGRGRLDLRVAAAGTAEVAELGRTFNAMLDRLEGSHEELARRAAELGSANEQLVEQVRERERAEAALRESEARYALAARAANDGLWDWDLRTGRVYYSPRWKAMLGLKEEEDSEGHIEDWLGLIHGDDVAQVRAELDAHLAGSRSHFRATYRVHHARDGTRWMLCRGVAVRDGQGQPVRLAGSQSDITAQKMAEQRLVYDALHDALTGLPNRGLLMDRLAHALQRSRRREPAVFAVLFVDLDRFKVINDSRGHAVGDRLLVDVARRVVSCLRPGDTCARMGGDEFAVLLDEVHTVQDAERIARRVADRIAEPMAVDGEEIYVQASIGITMADGGYSSGDEILRDADIAMYCAKKGGLRLKAFDPSMHAVTKSRMMLETELRGAIERGEFVLHYQPIVSVATGAVTAFEALIRWAHPRRGLVPPADFVPALEETRLIVPLGRWVLGEACRQLRQWQRDRPWLAAARVTVNVSNVQFAHPGFGDDVREAVDRSGLDPRCLILEMTESAVMHDPESAARLLDELRGMGVVTYLDDFGTGYSSLAQLPRIPIEGLKIDRQFIARMSRDRRDHEMVRAITAISSNLGMTVIAEGVEEADQLACLKDLRCDWAQGYLISRPLAPAALEAMLLDSPPGPDSAASHGWATP